MKTILLFSILFSVIAMPALGELTEADLNEIRLIVNDAEKRIKEEVKAEITITHTKIDGLDTRLRNVETNIAELRGRNIGFSAVQDWIVAICAVAAIILSIIALRKAQPKAPQTTQDTPKAVSQ